MISLIPRATEMVAVLGLADSLVGRSHECDCPTRVKGLRAFGTDSVMRGWGWMG